jgi:hypothetical protein
MITKINKPIFFVIITLIAFAWACSSENVTPQMVATAGKIEAEATNASGAINENTQEVATVEPTIGKTTFNTNDIIKIGDYLVVVLGWQDLKPNDYSKPDEGNKFIYVELLIVNIGKSTEYLSSLFQMNLKDDTAQKYDVDFEASVLLQYDINTSLVQGERVLGDIGFQIPQNAKGLVFVFDESLWSQGKLFVNLNPDPGISEPPGSLEGEVAPATLGVGETGTIGNIKITFNSFFTPKGSGYIKPDDGYEFLGVDITIENMGNESENVSSLLQMYLKDPLGHVIDVDMFASSAAGTSPEGEISAGEKVKGQIGFQVLKGSTGLVFVFDDVMNDNGKVFFKIN